MTAPTDPRDPRSIARRHANAQLAERALALAGGVAFHRPVHVYLQVASACNLDCYMCSEHNRPESERHGRGLRSMSPEVFAKVESEIFPWSSRTYIGVGGEPTIIPGFADFVRRAAQAGQEIHLVTNGTRFENGDIAEVVARDVAQLFVSMDAATPATYERIRRGAHWDRTIKGMRRLRDLRARAENGGCRLTLSFVLMRSNVRELPAFVDLAHELNAGTVHAQHVIPVNEEGRVESLFADMDLYRDVRADAQRRADELGIRLEAPQPFARPEFAPYVANGVRPAAAEITRDAREPVLESANGHASTRSGPPVPCSLPTTSFVVLYDGRVFPCCHPFAHQKLQIGDLRKESVADIWNDRQMRNLRVGLRAGDVPEICRNCSCAHDPPPGREDPEVLASSPDLAAHYGDRDLAPVVPQSGASVHDLIDRTGVSSYVEDLRQHSNLLEVERDMLRKHAATLEAERGHMIGHIANLERETIQVLMEKSGVSTYLEDLRQHATALEIERDALRKHAANLEAERGHQAGHIANLEEQHPQLVGHAANLERELAELRTRWTLRQRLVLRWRRMLGKLSAAVRATPLSSRAHQDQNPLDEGHA